MLRAMIAISAALLALIVVGFAAAWEPLTAHLFDGDATMTGMLLAATLAYALSYIVRGLVGGVRWFRGYGLGLLADAVGRLAVAAPLVIVASKSLAAFALVAAGLVGAAIPLYVGRRELRAVRSAGGGPRFHAGSALRFAAPAAVIAAADQLLVNGAPLLVVLGTGHAGKTAGSCLPRRCSCERPSMSSRVLPRPCCPTSPS